MSSMYKYLEILSFKNVPRGQSGVRNFTVLVKLFPEASEFEQFIRKAAGEASLDQFFSVRSKNRLKLCFHTKSQPN